MTRRVRQRASAEPAAPWRDGWWTPARVCISPNREPRPPGTIIDLVVIHSISLPPGCYGGDCIERLFTNRLDWDAHPYFTQIRGARVSSHFVIRRDGAPIQFVSCDERAWHAGASSWNGRDNCNDYSIGIELEGLEGERFEDAQYQTLTELLRGAGRALSDLGSRRSRARRARSQARPRRGIRLARPDVESGLAAGALSESSCRRLKA